ncbi:hypothetical protein EW145_g2911 [Phellinidium pouzarii]|uniref:DUF6741 domain-containing protein n=1 Tax=Phellinidium pouzarii TaxID=167371 RepID=A0A4S4L9A8_9AGAM|nr:hypothetical protein EW145_g2911 [Phellinidium pouzarii]
MAYSGAYATQALTHPSYSGRGANNYPYSPHTPAPGYDDYSRYPYGEPAYDDSADYAGYGDLHHAATPRSAYTTPRTNSHYGAYDDLALNRRSSYYGNDADYATYPSTPYASSAIAPSRSRMGRASSVSFHHQASVGPVSTSYYGSYDHRGKLPKIKFRSKYSTSGMSLADAVNGERPMGGDSYKWHELHADRNGEILLKVAWTGYRTITYRVPVDWYDGRVRISSLARRVARACIHYLQSNAIPQSWERVKIYSIEEITYGTWQPQLTVKQW